MTNQGSVLIVDDDHRLRTTLTDILTFKNFSITSVGTGQEALRAVQEKPVDVALIDLRLEDMPGIELLRRIKETNPGIECIMLTGHATVETGIEGMKLGAYDYLLKPCDIDVLMDKVKKAAARKREHDERIIQARLNEITLRRGM